MNTLGKYLDGWTIELLEAGRADKQKHQLQLVLTPAHIYDPRLPDGYVAPEPLKLVRPGPLEQFKYIELGALAAAATLLSPLVVYA